MAVATSTAVSIAANRLQRTVIHQPSAAATAQLVDLGQPQGGSLEMLPIKNYRKFSAQATASLLVGAGVTAFSIYAATDATGTGKVAVVTHAVGSAPDAEGDSLFLECDVEQVHESLSTATHVGVWIDAANDADEAAVVFTCEDPIYAVGGLTADYVV